DPVPSDQKAPPVFRQSVALVLKNLFGRAVPPLGSPTVNFNCPLEPRAIFNGSVTTAARVARGAGWLERERKIIYTVRIMMLASLLEGQGPCYLILGNNGLYGDEATCYERLGLVHMHDDSLEQRADLWPEEDFRII
ncbi:hypothetical protein ACHAQH_006310, partial [Verticillium albo-atrum]